MAPSKTPIEHDLLLDGLRRAGDAALGHFRSVRADLKDDGSQVTRADRDAEEILVTFLTRHFPGTCIVGEEGSRVPGTSGTWYVDPLDGTGAFLDGLDSWGPTIALHTDEGFRLGAFYQPRTRTYWFAERHRGAYRDGDRLLASPRGSIGRNSSLFVPSRIHQGPPLPWPGKIRALGSSAAHLAHTATRPDSATVLGRWAPWDIGCGLLLLGETERWVTDLTGRPVDPMDHPGRAFLAGSPSAIRHLVAHASSVRTQESHR